MENWKNGMMENWKNGRMEEWENSTIWQMATADFLFAPRYAPCLTALRHSGRQVCTLQHNTNFKMINHENI